MNASRQGNAKRIPSKRAAAKQRTKPEPSEMKIRERKVTATVTEMVDTVEGYFSLAPWDWIYGEDGDFSYRVFKRIPDAHKFNRFHRWAPKKRL